MKTIEEKAKAYDNIIEKANKMHSENCEACQMCIEELIPELAESEDEKLKEQVVYAINQLHVCECTKNKLISWLEEQGEQKPENYDHEMWKNCQANFEGGKNEVINNPEKYGLQKPVEPTDLKTWKYIVDAVLTEREGIGQYIDSPWTTDVAEKLQKRFGNIEQKPAWSEEDEEIIRDIHCFLSYRINCHLQEQETQERAKKIVSWLDELKNRVLSQPKQEWSKEDEYYHNIIMYCLNGESVGNADKENAVLWLKSLRLKTTWKPSDEQIDALEKECIAHFNYELCRLLEQLKKLKN